LETAFETGFFQFANSTIRMTQPCIVAYLASTLQAQSASSRTWATLGAKCAKLGLAES